MTRTLDEYKELLRQQLEFIKNSAKLFDQGEYIEAARIAVCLRVLLHDTGKSISLLTHMNAQNIKLGSNTSDDTAILARYPDIKAFQKLSLVTIEINKCAPILSAPRRFVDISTWLSECIISNPPDKYSRNDIILFVANKDGGAHVDAVLPPEYETLKAEGAIGTLEFNGELKPIKDAPYAILRAMAAEILQSPELLALLN